MRIGSDFATVSALRLKVRAQARRISELESGGAFAEEREARLRLQREYESRVRSLRREVADLGRLNSKMCRGWWETCEMVRREGEEAVANAMRTELESLGAWRVCMVYRPSYARTTDAFLAGLVVDISRWRIVLHQDLFPTIHHE